MVFVAIANVAFAVAALTFMFVQVSVNRELSRRVSSLEARQLERDLGPVPGRPGGAPGNRN